MTPVTARNTRWKWNGLIPAARARVSRLGAVSAASIRRQAACATISARRSARAGASGRQRLHGRKPAASASAPVAWKLTFSGRAARAPQLGRQYTPVVRTA